MPGGSTSSDGKSKSRPAYPTLVPQPYGRSKAEELVSAYPRTQKLIRDGNATPDEIVEQLRLEYAASFKQPDPHDMNVFVDQVLRTLQLKHPAHLDVPGFRKTERRMLS